MTIPLSSGGTRSLPVFCLVDLDGSKWLLFQRRTENQTNFNRNWASYAAGFGGPPSLDNTAGNSFWLGLDTLFEITRVGSWLLRIDLQDQVNGATAYALYRDFSIGPASGLYVLNVGAYSGTAGDALSFQSNATNHNGLPFSTFDADHDKTVSNCAQLYKGGWWYNFCHRANLNGILYPSGCYSDYGTGTDWCGWSNGSKIFSFPGVSNCNVSQSSPLPFEQCHYNSLRAWMFLG